ncbi:hypothetical protein D1AOALGA4SA_12589 [Olavius algarvensis Delta 1 endosymbiont]|nr:hypothetical protein D1AOALGA4SA_12589 [Olavius algarvensis Delta 1 endosymbiont]
MSQLQALLGFVTLNPTYILAVLSRNAKPNSSRFRNRFLKGFFSDQSGCPLARDSTLMKLQSRFQVFRRRRIQKSR